MVSQARSANQSEKSKLSTKQGRETQQSLPTYLDPHLREDKFPSGRTSLVPPGVTGVGSDKGLEVIIRSSRRE